MPSLTKSHNPPTIRPPSARAGYDSRTVSAPPSAPLRGRMGRIPGPVSQTNNPPRPPGADPVSQTSPVVRSIMLPDRLGSQDVERFWSYVRVVRRGRWVCWEWQGKRCRYGYGRFWLGGRWTSAHCVAYRFFAADTGSVFLARLRTIRLLPADRPQLDHRCVNSRCVRPSHLEPVTCKENHERRVARSLPNPASPASSNRPKRPAVSRRKPSPS